MNILIFGAGKGGENAHHLFTVDDKVNVIGFCDNNQNIWGSKKLSLPIYSPAEITSLDYDKIIIASQYRKDIFPQLCELGVPESNILIAHQNIMDGISLTPNIFESFGYSEPPEYIPYKTFREEVFHILSKHVELVEATGVKGDIAEFGCGTGQSSYVIAKALKKCNQYYQQNKKLFLFDSFEGLPESTSSIDKASPMVSQGVWGECSCAGISEKDLENTLKNELQFSSFEIHKGWFCDTLPKASPSSFSLVHLDCDLYQSTYDALSHLLSNEQLANGAVLLFDDWSCNHNDPSFGQQKAWSDINEVFNIHFSSRGYYGLGSHIIVIHSYSSK